MRSFVIDSNALIYWLHAGSPKYEEVNAFLGAALEQDCGVYVLSSSLNEVYYALHTHYLSEADARASTSEVADLLDVVELTGLLVHQSLAGNEPDYEDGLIRALAEHYEVDAIVSYDRKAFRASRIPKLTAGKALSTLMVPRKQ